MCDAQYENVKEIVKTEESWTVSKLQRLMKWGYNRAAWCMQHLAEDGVLSAPDSRGVQKLIRPT